MLHLSYTQLHREIIFAYITHAIAANFGAIIQSLVGLQEQLQ